MKLKILYLTISLLSLLLVVGCSNDNISGDTLDNENYESVREVVWDFIVEQGWSHNYSKENWRNATVKKTIADDRYKTLDATYNGKEILIVGLEDAVASPSIFVDPKNNKVIGYMPGE
ncbi:hypothetical protein ACFVR1_18600 [Psychrobacillus sp. NPDC058041]|uniref:hypothetical protein n=1 Tax=Psychrobacillus sp. NPDC058041 TaxID=3346310 RepID=UPI0036D7C0B6